jgi:DHA2 family multidrug resistance protein-like MFS transporter
MSDTPVRRGLPRQRIRAVLAVTLATATVSFDGSIPNVALPTIARELGVAGSSAVSIISTYQITLVVTLLPFAALAERIGHRRTLRIGLMLFIAGGLLCTLARTLPVLVALRICQSLGAAAVLSIGAALIRSLYPPEWLGRGLALNTLISTATMSLAPTVGGLMLSVLPWYWLFAIGVPTTVAALLLCGIIPESEKRDTPFDIPGAIYCMASFGLVFAGIESAVHGAAPLLTAALFGLGVPVAVRFVQRELRAPLPILPLDLLQRPMIALSVGGAMLTFIASTSVLVTLPFRLYGQFGLGTAATGAILATWSLTMMFCAPTAGILSDRVPATVLGAFGMAVATTGALLLALIPEGAKGFDISWRIAVCAAGYAFYVSPTFRMVVNAAPPARVAPAGSLMTTARMSGQALGATASATMLALGIGQGAAPAAIAAVLFLVAGVLGLIRLAPGMRH